MFVSKLAVNQGVGIVPATTTGGDRLSMECEAREEGGTSVRSNLKANA